MVILNCSKHDHGEQLEVFKEFSSLLNVWALGATCISSARKREMQTFKSVNFPESCKASVCLV